jgi:hypothetical protein
LNPLKFIEPLQPPLKASVFVQFCKAMLSEKVVWQPGLIKLAGQVNDGGGAAVTVKVA